MNYADIRDPLFRRAVEAKDEAMRNNYRRSKTISLGAGRFYQRLE